MNDTNHPLGFERLEPPLDAAVKAILAESIPEAAIERVKSCASLLAAALLPPSRASGFHNRDSEGRVLAKWRTAKFNIPLRPGARKAIAAAAAAILLGTVGYVGTELMEHNRLPGAAALPGAGRQTAMLTDTSAATSEPGKQDKPNETPTIAALVKTTQQLTREGRFQQAQGVLQEILARDPKNEYALGVRQLVADQVIIAEQKGIREGFYRQDPTQLNAAEERKIPYLEVMRYPDNWPDIAEMRDRETTGLGENGRDLTKSGSGTLTLSGASTYTTGATQIANGTLQWSEEDLGKTGDSGIVKELGGLENQPNGGSVHKTASASTLGNKKLNNTLDWTRGGEGENKLKVTTGEHFKLSGLNAWGFDQGKEGRNGEGDVNPSLGDVSVSGTDTVALKAGAGLDRSVGTVDDIVSFGKLAQADGRTPAKVDPQAPPAPEASVVQARKIIRNGDMEFEVDSFDTSFATISRIVGEEKGYVSSTSSEKLPNGKVRGVIVVRVTPDRLDTLVLKLRALGDLKSQKISAQDITKVYYDLDSELRAARTMEERIINIIKTGKGEVKDLIEAEKQLGTYREKIEKLEGEIRYYNNMVSLSTLNITAAEKAISSPAAVQVTENVSAGIEAEDVEKARADAIKGIEELKGRVVDSNLKKYDGGQFAANITAEVSPEASGQLIDRLRQIGRLTRLDIDRKQTSAGQPLPNAPAPRVEKKDTRLVISIYNLANIAPRQTTTASLAVANVEEAYKSILASVKAKGGRVVSSNLNQQQPEQKTAAISFEVPADQADATLLELRRDREVMSLTVAENPDTQNVTAAKHGFSLQICSLASVAARETETLVLVSKANVNDAFRKLLGELRKADVRILTSQLSEQDASNLSGSIDIEVSRAKEAEARAALASAGVIFSRNVARSSDTDNTVDTKIRLQIRMVGLNQLAPAQTVRLNVETPDVEARAGDLKDAAVQLGGRVVDSRQSTSATGQVTSRLVLDVPLAKALDLRAKAQDAGKVRTTDSTQNPAMADSPLARARLEVTLTNASPIVSDDSGLGAAFRKAVATSVRGLLWSVQAIIIGALIVVPWAAILWGGCKLVRRGKKAKAAMVEAA